jgi:tetratricopeptide (TPR) repeat protein
LRVALIFVLVCFIFGCASPPPPPEATEEEKNEEASVREEMSAFLTSVENSMKEGTPEAFQQAVRKLVNSPAGESARGEELLYIAVNLHEIFYPLLEQPGVTVTVPANNTYRRIFDTTRNGTLIGEELLDRRDAGRFFTLVASATVVLYSEDDEIEAAAAENLEQAAELQPASVLPRYLLGVLAQRSGELDRAEQYLRRAVLSGCYPAKVRLAEVLLSKEEYFESWEITQQLLERFPDYEKLLRTAAYTQYHLGNFDQALVFVDEVLQREENSEMLLLRLQILWRQQKFEFAKRFLTIVKKQYEATAKLAYIEADILYQTGDNGEALDVLDKALLSYPEDEQLLQLYDKILFDIAFTEGQWARAAELLEKLLSEDSTVELLEKGTVIYRNLGATEKTAQLAEELFEIDSSNPQYITNYVRASLSAGNTLTETERAELELLIERGLKNAESRKTRSELYLLQSSLYEDPQKKLELLQNSLFENLQNSDALAAISAVYEEIGDIPKALRYLKQAALLLPENQAIREKIEALEAQL